MILISLDTTRPDRLGIYGCERETSPHLDALAEDAVVYTGAYSTTSWTLPAHASLLTGKLPAGHGARYDENGPLALTDAIRGPAGWEQKYRVRGLSAGERTLAEILAEAGYATAAVVAGPWLKRPFGLDQGFEHYDDREIDEVNGRRAGSVTDSALEWLAAHSSEPFFLFLNYFDPHTPYAAPPPYDRAFAAEVADVPDASGPAARRAAYDAEILYMDAEIGRLIRNLRETGLYAKALIIVTADHGELLGERGRFGHGSSLLEAEIRIPLIVKSPRSAGAGGREAQRVLITDVFATILHATGLETPPGTQSEPLPRVGHPIVAELRPLTGAPRDWQAILEGSFKWIRNSERAQLIDLLSDPSEEEDASGRYPDRAQELEATLRDYLAAIPTPAPPGPAQTIDRETRRALEGLGYLE